MSATHPTPSESSALSNGQNETKPDWKRAAHGKFAAGNRGGPGNPFARRTAKLRQAFCQAITEEDLTKLARDLFERAMNGDCGAARLVLTYMLGKPAAVVDPDTLDAQEWDNCKQYFIGPEELPELVRLLPKEVLVDMAKTAMPEIARQHCANLSALMTANEDDNPEVAPAPPPPAPRSASPEGEVVNESANGHAPATPDNGKVGKAANGKPAKRRYQSGRNGAAAALSRTHSAKSVNGHVSAKSDKGKLRKTANGKPVKRRYQSGCNGATTARPRPVHSKARSVSR